MINAIVAIGQVSWEAQFVSSLSHPMTGIQIQRRCVDAIDVLAVVKVISCDVVVISDQTMRVDAEFISEIRKLGIRLVALTQNPNFYQNLGDVECVSLEPNNPLSVLSTLISLLKVNNQIPVSAPVSIGEFIFIGGFGGGTYKTRLAMELAYQMSLKQKRTLLIDADVYGPTILQLLNLPVATPSILEICRKVERKTNVQNFLTENTVLISENLYFLPGLIKTSRWVDLRPSVLKELWQIALAEFEYIFVDAGPVLEPDPVIEIELGLPKRNLVGASSLAISSKVVLTTRRDPVSVTRLIRGIIGSASSFTNKSVTAVISGPPQKGNPKELINAVRSHADISSVQIINTDDLSIERAEKKNTFIGMLNPKCGLVHSYQKLLDEILAHEKNTGTNSRLNRLFPKRHAFVTDRELKIAT